MMANKTNDFDKARAEIENNLRAYINKYKDNLETEHHGKIALLHHGELVKVCDDFDAAYAFGCEEYGLGDFSLKEIGQKPVSMGSMSRLARTLEVA